MLCGVQHSFYYYAEYRYSERNSCIRTSDTKYNHSLGQLHFEKFSLQYETIQLKICGNSLRDGTERSEDLVQDGCVDPGVGLLEAEELLGELEDVEDDVVLLLDDAAKEDHRELEQSEEIIRQSERF